MKKYELIKTYPNSLPIGTIVKKDSLGQYVTENVHIFQREDVEDFPEFWQEIPEFKILKFIDKISNLSQNKNLKIYNVLSDNNLLLDWPDYEGITTNPGAMSVEEAILKDSPYDIYSIQRTSDGEIFTVGDKITIGIHTHRNHTTIDRIYINEHNQLSFSILNNKPKQATTVLTDDVLKYEPTRALSYDQLIHGKIYKTSFKDQGTYIFRCGYNLWRHEDNPIVTENLGDFTPKNGFNEFYLATEEEDKKLERNLSCVTEDGIKLYEGDEYWFIYMKNMYHIKAYTPTYVKNISYPFNKAIEGLIFSTKEAVDNYLKEKVLFTTEDGVKIYPNDEVYQVDENLYWYYFKHWDASLGENGKPKKGRVSFSTKFLAQQYIEQNKPIFSMNDIKSLTSSILYNTQKALLNIKLEKLKNEKIQVN